MKDNYKNKISTGTLKYQSTYQPRITYLDLILGEALLLHIAQFKSPQREQELVKFVLNDNNNIDYYVEDYNKPHSAISVPIV
jgi:hypothetical protein